MELNDMLVQMATPEKKSSGKKIKEEFATEDMVSGETLKVRAEKDDPTSDLTPEQKKQWKLFFKRGRS